MSLLIVGAENKMIQWLIISYLQSDYLVHHHIYHRLDYHLDHRLDHHLDHILSAG